MTKSNTLEIRGEVSKRDFCLFSDYSGKLHLYFKFKLQSNLALEDLSYTPSKITLVPNLKSQDPEFTKNKAQPELEQAPVLYVVPHNHSLSLTVAPNDQILPTEQTTQRFNDLNQIQLKRLAWLHDQFLNICQIDPQLFNVYYASPKTNKDQSLSFKAYNHSLAFRKERSVLDLFKSNFFESYGHTRAFNANAYFQPQAFKLNQVGSLDKTSLRTKVGLAPNQYVVKVEQNAIFYEWVHCGFIRKLRADEERELLLKFSKSCKSHHNNFKQEQVLNQQEQFNQTEAFTGQVSTVGSDFIANQALAYAPTQDRFNCTNSFGLNQQVVPVANANQSFNHQKPSLQQANSNCYELNYFEHLYRLNTQESETEQAKSIFNDSFAQAQSSFAQALVNKLNKVCFLLDQAMELFKQPFPALPQLTTMALPMPYGLPGANLAPTYAFLAKSRDTLKAQAQEIEEQKLKAKKQEQELAKYQAQAKKIAQLSLSYFRFAQAQRARDFELFKQNFVYEIEPSTIQLKSKAFRALSFKARYRRAQHKAQSASHKRLRLDFEQAQIELLNLQQLLEQRQIIYLDHHKLLALKASDQLTNVRVQDLNLVELNPLEIEQALSVLWDKVKLYKKAQSYKYLQGLDLSEQEIKANEHKSGFYQINLIEDPLTQTVQKSIEFIATPEQPEQSIFNNSLNQTFSSNQSLSSNVDIQLFNQALCSSVDFQNSQALAWLNDYLLALLSSFNFKEQQKQPANISDLQLSQNQVSDHSQVCLPEQESKQDLVCESEQEPSVQAKYMAVLVDCSNQDIFSFYQLLEQQVGEHFYFKAKLKLSDSNLVTQNNDQDILSLALAQSLIKLEQIVLKVKDPSSLEQAQDYSSNYHGQSRQGSKEKSLFTSDLANKSVTKANCPYFKQDLALNIKFKLIEWVRLFIKDLDFKKIKLEQVNYKFVGSIQVEQEQAKQSFKANNRANSFVLAWFLVQSYAGLTLSNLLWVKPYFKTRVLLNASLVSNMSNLSRINQEPTKLKTGSLNLSEYVPLFNLLNNQAKHCFSLSLSKLDQRWTLQLSSFNALFILRNGFCDWTGVVNYQFKINNLDGVDWTNHVMTKPNQEQAKAKNLEQFKKHSIDSLSFQVAEDPRQFAKDCKEHGRLWALGLKPEPLRDFKDLLDPLH